VLTHARRQHRWVRGDWQILWWLFPWVPTRSGLQRNQLPMVARWKILDNLRRSLVPPSLVALLIAGWTLLPGRPFVWTVVALTTMSFPVAARLFELVRGPRRGQGWLVFLRAFGEDLETDLARVSVQLTFVAYHAWDMVNAVAVTLARLVSRRGRFLQWETAAAVAQRTRRLSAAGFYDSMRSSPTIATLALLSVIVLQPWAFPVAAPIIALWYSAPLIAFVLSKPAPSSRPELTDPDRAYLRDLAARTWRYFDTYVTADDRWLPPDNVQFDPEPRIAHRTSPTNIAMTLLSTLSAYDLELIDVETLAGRLEATLTTVDRLEHFEGHLLNWYDTQTLEPLLPKYVSTVDSGNFAAALLTLGSGLREIAQRSDGAIVERLEAKCTSASSTTASAGCLRSATGSRIQWAPRAWTDRSTTCSRRKRGSPASLPSPRATCRRCTGSTSAA
jgi:cyclic beta-1,2-glucan synthetase